MRRYLQQTNGLQTPKRLCVCRQQGYGDEATCPLDKQKFPVAKVYVVLMGGGEITLPGT